MRMVGADPASPSVAWMFTPEPVQPKHHQHEIPQFDLNHRWLPWKLHLLDWILIVFHILQSTPHRAQMRLLLRQYSMLFGLRLLWFDKPI